MCRSSSSVRLTRAQPRSQLAGAAVCVWPFPLLASCSGVLPGPREPADRFFGLSIDNHTLSFPRRLQTHSRSLLQTPLVAVLRALASWPMARNGDLPFFPSLLLALAWFSVLIDNLFLNKSGIEDLTSVRPTQMLPVDILLTTI